MQEQRKKSVFKQVCLIIFVTCASILFILNVEENSDIQSVIVFFIGMAFASSSQSYVSKVDVYINYLLILTYFLFWYFFVPNKIQSLLFLVGALTMRSFKKDLAKA